MPSCPMSATSSPRNFACLPWRCPPMPRLDPLHYVDFIVWAAAAYARLPTPERRDAFTHAVLTLLHSFTAPFSDLPKGKALALLPGIYAWLKKYPDPLQGLRAAMDGMKVRW